MKTIEEIKKEIAKECAEEHFDVIFEAELMAGDFKQARNLWNMVLDRYLEQYEKPIESKTGYSCPNCGAIRTANTLVSQTEVEFDELPDPHYKWDEIHRCQYCYTLYLLHNGT